MKGEAINAIRGTPGRKGVGTGFPARRVVLWLTSLLVVVAACSRTTPHPVQDAVVAKQPEAAHPTHLRHDFGIVRPGSQSTHRFRIHNPTTEPWTLERLVRTCRCTTTSVSSQVVPAGGDLLVDVRYTAPSKEGADARAVELCFRERGPVCRLEVAALVRHELHLSERELKIESDERFASAALIAANYSDQPWSGLRATTAAPWLSVDLFRVNDELGATARQAWRVTITADTALLPLADDRAVVSFMPQGNSEKHVAQDVVVRVLRTPPVQCIPDRLFLGAGGSGPAC